MARKTPTVWVSMVGGAWQATLECPGEQGPAIRLDSAAWFGWLEATTTRSFAYPIYDPQVGYIRGWLTVRKEQRRRGTTYWVVYHRRGRTVQKRYVGRSLRLTAQQLATIAARFLATTAPANGLSERRSQRA